MTDIASLGLNIDSRPAAALADDLNKLSAAGKAAEQGVKAFEQSTTRAGQAAQGLGKHVQAAINSAEQINRRLNVRDSFGGAERAADIAAWGQQLDMLERKYAPLSAAQRQYVAEQDEIAMAVRAGVINEEQKAVALVNAEQRYKNTTKAITLNEQAIQKSGKAALVSGYQYQNLAFQVNDVATMAAMGMDPLRILTSQAGQFYQVLAMTEGGARVAAREIGGYLLSLVNPFNVAATAALAFGAAAVAAFTSWRSAQREIQRSLVGIGAASGVTAEMINEISFASHEAGVATVGQAREMAMAFASTGKIGKEIMTELIMVGRDVAKIYGEDITEAADRLAGAFADPAKGVDELNRRFAAFDQRTAQNIKTLAAHGDRLNAQRVLVSNLKDAIQDAGISTGFWARQWTTVSSAFSGWWANFGQFLDEATGGGTLERQIEATQRFLRENRNSLFSQWSGDIDAAESRLRELNAQLERTARRSKEAEINLRAMAAMDVANKIAPDFNQKSAMEADLSLLKQAASDQALINTLSASQVETLNRALAIQKLKVIAHKSEADIAVERHNLDLQSIFARTTAQKADIEYQRTINQATRAGLTAIEATTLALQAKERVLAEARAQEEQALREQTFARGEALSRMELEIQLIGKTEAQAEGLRAAWEEVAAARRRAFDRGETLSGDALAAVEADAAGFGAQITARTLRRGGRELEREQRSPTEIFEEEMRRIDELRQADAISHEAWLGAKNQAEYEYMMTTQSILANERSMREQTFNLAAGLLDQFAGKSKTAAIAAIALNKAVQIANVVMNTISASAAALAPPPLGLGPVAGAPLAASIKAWGAAQVGLIAATGIAQAAGAGKSSGAPSSRGSGGSARVAELPQTGGFAPAATTHITVTGSRFSKDELRELIEDMNNAISDGAGRFELGFG